MKQERSASWYLMVILRNRRFLIGALAAVMIPTVIVSFLLTKKYTVTTVIMPPEEQIDVGLSIGGMGMSEFAGYFGGGMGFSLPLMTTMSDVYVEILRSRTLIDEVILSTGYLDSADVRDKYEKDPNVGMYWARREFNNNYTASVTPSGFIEIKMTTDDPWYSVRVSERVVEVLDSLNTSIYLSRAQRARELLELKLEVADSMFAAASAALTAFETEHGVISPDEEMSHLISTLASLKQQYLELRANASALSSGFSSGGTMAAIEMERQAAALLRVIDNLESGAGAAPDSLFPSVSLEGYADIQFEYARLKSDFETALVLSSTLRASLQQTAVEERRQDRGVRTLDPPGHPGWKSKPKRIIIWLEVFGAALVLLLTFVFIRERVWQFRATHPEDWAEWSVLLGDLRKDLAFPFRRSQPRDTSSRSDR